MQEKLRLYDLLCFVFPGLALDLSLLWLLWPAVRRWLDNASPTMPESSVIPPVLAAVGTLLLLLLGYYTGHVIQHLTAQIETLVQRRRLARLPRRPWWYVSQAYIAPRNWPPALLASVQADMLKQLVPEQHAAHVDEAFLALLCASMLNERGAGGPYAHNCQMSWMYRGLAFSTVAILVIIWVGGLSLARCSWTAAMTWTPWLMLAAYCFTRRWVQFYAQASDHVFRQCLLLLHPPNWGLSKGSESRVC